MIGMGFDKVSLLIIQAITSIHPGIGRTVGTVDMPVQRDFLGFPEIASTSIKGAWRSYVHNVYRDSTEKKIFGDDGPSNVSILDAKVLLTPVRSLKGIILGSTSTLMLKKLKSYLEIGGDRFDKNNDIEAFKEILSKVISNSRSINMDECYISANIEKYNIKDIINSSEDSVLVNEDFKLKILGKQSELERIIQSLDLRNDLLNYNDVILVHDDVYSQLVNRSIIRQTRVKLREEAKTVEAGPWTEEHIPEGTVFYTLLFYKSEIKNDVHSTFNDKFLIIGGDETVGKGIVYTRLVGV